MFYRFALASIPALILLNGCASRPSSEPAASFNNGACVLNVSHIVSRTDDGSEVHLTVDGKDAGLLDDGESKQLHVSPGEHKIGGYVPTLFGYGRVTIQPVAVTTTADNVKHVAYSVTRDKPVFSEWNVAPG